MHIMTAMLRSPWATSLQCHGALGVPPAIVRRVCCDATTTCFRGDLTALVLSMFKTWRRPWRPSCNLQGCYGALRDLTTTQRRSGRFCRSQRGRRPVWLGYNEENISMSRHHVCISPKIPVVNWIFWNILVLHISELGWMSDRSAASLCFHVYYVFMGLPVIPPCTYDIL